MGKRGGPGGFLCGTALLMFAARLCSLEGLEAWPEASSGFGFMLCLPCCTQMPCSVPTMPHVLKRQIPE